MVDEIETRNEVTHEQLFATSQAEEPTEQGNAEHQSTDEPSLRGGESSSELNENHAVTLQNLPIPVNWTGFGAFSLFHESKARVLIGIPIINRGQIGVQIQNQPGPSKFFEATRRAIDVCFVAKSSVRMDGPARSQSLRPA